MLALRDAHLLLLRLGYGQTFEAQQLLHQLVILKGTQGCDGSTVFGAQRGAVSPHTLQPLETKSATSPASTGIK